MLKLSGGSAPGRRRYSGDPKGGKDPAVSILLYVPRYAHPILKIGLGFIVHFERIVIDLISGNDNVGAFELVHVVHDESESFIQRVLVIGVVDELVNHYMPDFRN